MFRVSTWLLLISLVLFHNGANAQSNDIRLGKIALNSLNIKGAKNQRAILFCHSTKIYILYQNVKKKKITIPWSSKYSKKLSTSEKKTIKKYFSKCTSKRSSNIPQTPIPTISPEYISTPAPSFQASHQKIEININQSSFYLTSSQAVSISGICSFCDRTKLLELSFQDSALGKFSYNIPSKLGLVELNQDILPAEEHVFNINFEAYPYKAGKEDIKVTVLSDNESIGSFTIQVNIPGTQTIVGNNSIFINPVDGNDLHDGSFNAPLNTFNQAIKKALSIFTTDSHAQVEIILAGGTYYTGYTGIDFDLSKIAPDGSLNIKPLNDETPIVFFGIKLPSSHWVNISGNKWSYCDIASLNIPQFSPTSSSYNTATKHEVITPYLNDTLMRLARFPNEGYLNVTNFTSNIASISAQLPSIGTGEFVRAIVSPGVQTGAIRGKASVSNGGLKFEDSFMANGAGSTKTNNPIYLEGHPALLDTDDEYYFEHNCLTIYKKNFNPSLDEVSISSSSNKYGIRFFNNSTQIQTGSVSIERISFSGGASVTEFNASKGPGCGTYSEAEELSLIKLENAQNISIDYSKFGPSAIPAIYGHKNTSQISISNSIFKKVSGSALILVGNIFIEEPSVKEINFNNNIVRDMSSSCPNSDAIHLESVGNSNIKGNTIVNSQRRGIGIFGTKYKYAVNHWINKCSDPSNSSPTDECDRGFLPWSSYKKYNPVRGITVSKNLIIDTRDPQLFHDGGLVYTWGVAQSINGGPSVLFDQNVILNSRESTQNGHLTLWYNDDAANNVTLSNSIIVSTSFSSAIPIFAKGYQTNILDNLIYSPYESNWPMLIQNEFLAIDPPSDLISKMEFNLDLNRSLRIIGNGFFQLPKVRERANGETLYKNSELFSFNQWGDVSNMGDVSIFGPVVEESNDNIFSLESGYNGKNQITVNSSASVNPMSLSEWTKGTGIGLSGEVLDSESIFISNPSLPSREEMKAGTFLPADSSVRSRFSHLEGLVVGASAPCQMFASDCIDSAKELIVR